MPATLDNLSATIGVYRAELEKRRSLDRLTHSIPPKARVMLHPARYKGLFGGRGSAKSQTFARLLLLRCKLHPGTRWLCGREVQMSLGQSVKQLLKDIIEEFELSDFEVLNTQIRTPGGGLIAFHGMQTHTVASIKSLEGFDGVWVEEAQTVSSRSLELLRPTIRKPGSELWFSWNPEKASDPIEFLRSTPPRDTRILEMNWSDNPYFPQVLRDEMDGDYLRDPELAAHIWAGKYKTRSDATVFKNWRVEPFETPSEAAFLLGGDWGFAVDPTVLVRSFIRGNDLCVDHEVYQVGCDIDDTPALFDSLACTKDHTHDIEKPRQDRSSSPTCTAFARGWEITSDSARPETISFMQQHGYPRIVAAVKGNGSVEDGIAFLKSYNIIVHPRCQHVIDELTGYSFKKHPLTGSVLPQLEDKRNHTIDSLRYMIEPVRRAKTDGSLVW